MLTLRRVPSLPSRYRDPVAVLLLLCAGAVFLPSLGAYFLSDDFVLLSWTRGASPADVLGFFDPATEWFYRPLVKVYYWAGQSLFGVRAIPLHALSILLHVANAYLLYRLVVRHGTVPWGGALFVALIFLLNTRHAETVSWVAAVGDLGGTVCILGSILLFGRFLEHGRHT